MPDPIVLFDGAPGGYGDAVAAGRRGYHMTYNMDCLAEGRATVAVVPTGLSVTAGDILREITAVLGWETVVGRPFILAAGAKVSGGTVYRAVGKIQDGSYSIEDFQSGNPYTGGVLYRNDGSDVDAEMAFFCNGASGAVLRRRNKVGAYSDATDAKADGLAVIGGDLWRWKGYKLAKCTYNADPALDASFAPNEEPVGRPSYPINSVVELGGSPIVLKGDGAFRFNPAGAQAGFHNLTPFVDAIAHPDNGKGGTVDGRGRVYYPLVDGHVLVITFGAQSQQGPLRFSRFDRNTPWGAISALIAGPEYIYAAIEPGSIRTQELGLTVKTYDDSASAYTDHTSVVT